MGQFRAVFHTKFKSSFLNNHTYTFHKLYIFHKIYNKNIYLKDGRDYFQFSNVNNTAWLTSCYSIEAASIHLPDGSTLAGVTVFCLSVISWSFAPNVQNLCGGPEFSE